MYNSLRINSFHHQFLENLPQKQEAEQSERTKSVTLIPPRFEHEHEHDDEHDLAAALRTFAYLCVMFLSVGGVYAGERTLPFNVKIFDRNGRRLSSGADGECDRAQTVSVLARGLIGEYVAIKVLQGKGVLFRPEQKLQAAFFFNDFDLAE